MDNDDGMIDDWLSGEECDPTDYDLYEVDRFERFMGLDDDDNSNHTRDYSNYHKPDASEE